MSENNTNNYGRAALYGFVAAIMLLTGVRGALMDTGLGNLAEFLLGALTGAVVAAAAIGVSVLLVRVAGRLPLLFVSGLFAALLVTLFFDANSPGEIAQTVLDADAWGWPFDRPTGLDVVSMLVLAVTPGLLFATVFIARRRALPEHPWLLASTGAGVAASIAVLVTLSNVGHDPYDTEFSNFATASWLPGLPDDPSANGSYEIEYFTYGAGDNPRRPEFGARRRLDSRTVDASKLLPEWKGLKARMREGYWGFGLEEAPLNALVWAPIGDGPFPLALIVHGNHGMEDYSDTGYRYLGELLASRGFIAVSVDQNYINGTWSGDFRGREMPARAWLLLEHLELWRDWSRSEDHPLGARVDMDNVSLIGHSRGGEAVSIAYAYNDLPHYPDDATVEFDYGFNIRSLVAIAQVDQRYHRRVELNDVSFLALQGSYDSDEPAFHGLRQYNRIDLTGSDYHFKAGIYIHGANHGQFNSGWGNTDYSPPQSWLLNLAPLIPAADQERIAQVYISAFLEATLRQDRRYLPLFRDPRVAADILPDHPYVQQFTDSTFQPIATFEEDLDVGTLTAGTGVIETDGLTLWREEELQHRDERKQGSSAVVLGWQDGAAARFTLGLPDGITIDSGADPVLTLAVSASTEKPAGGDDDDDDSDQDSDESDDDAPTAAPRLRLRILLDDQTTVELDSADYAELAPPLKVRYLKNEAENKSRYKSDWEAVLQQLEIPFTAFGGDPRRVRAISFSFPDIPSGVVIIDDIGTRTSPPDNSLL